MFKHVYSKLLNSNEEILKLILEETAKQISLFVNTKNGKGQRVYGKRLTDYEYNKLDTDLAALTKEEDCTILFSNNGYLRRVPVSEFEQQNRGTRGKKIMKLKEKDFIAKAINSHSHATVMMVTEKGKVYSMYAYELTDNLGGRHINNILEIDKDELVHLINRRHLAEQGKVDAIFNYFSETNIDNDNLNSFLIDNNSLH